MYKPRRFTFLLAIIFCLTVQSNFILNNNSKAEDLLQVEGLISEVYSNSLRVFNIDKQSSKLYELHDNATIYGTKGSKEILLATLEETRDFGKLFKEGSSAILYIAPESQNIVKIVLKESPQ